MDSINVRAFPLACPCGRGYLYLLVTQPNGVPIAFGIHDGILIIQGYCDTCNSLVQYMVPLADLAINEPEDWETKTFIVKQGRLN